jgi:bacteriocin biosynthesis cyclodehydratase domain-containing protein
VRVRGAGRVGGPLATLLAAAGVGRVVVEDAGATRPADLAPGGLLGRDLNRPRGAALTRRLPRPVPRAARGRDDLVVLALPGPGDPDPAQARALLLAGTPHLAVGVRENTGWLGPLVLPGSGPCLGCLERHRIDRDPAWPLIAAQLGTPAARVVDPCAISLALTVAGLAATQVLSWLDHGGPGLPAAVADGTFGGVLEIAHPGWRVRRRGFAVHPACDCRGAAGRPEPREGAHLPEGTATMAG